MEKLFRRAGVLAGPEEGLRMLLSTYAEETLQEVLIRAKHDYRKHAEVRDVVATKVRTAA
jgi:hypothetical protein